MITNKIVKIERDNELKRSLLDYSSRYQKSDLIYYSDFNIITLETYDRTYNPVLDNKEIQGIKFYLITKGTEYKPWLVSYEAYGDAGYWWLIMEFNNFFDIEEFESGKTIRIPPITITQ